MSPAKSTGNQKKSSGWSCDYPMSSVAIVFGIGIGAGMALGSLLDGPDTSRQSMGRRTEEAAERLGRQMLDAVAGVLPKSLAKHIEA